ncbi:MAG: cell division protein ZapA [candidate division WOR-3 bacterium]
MERIREVVIRGKKYEVRTDLSDEDLKNVVNIVNDILLESEKSTVTPDFEVISILALLSLAEKVYFCEKKFDLAQKKVYSLIRRIENI